jgi:hypothetical protein
MTDTQTEERTRTDEAKERATDVAGGAGEKAGEVVDHAKDRAAEVASSAAEQAADVLGATRDELRTRATDEASAFGDRLTSVADELRAMGRASEDSGGTTAGLVNSLADQVERGAQRLSDGDLEQVLGDVKRFARNRPGTFLLGAAGAGFVIGRLLNAADLKQVGQAAKPGSGDDQLPTGGDQGSGNGVGALGAGMPSTPVAPSASAPNPGSSPTPTAGTGIAG